MDNTEFESQNASSNLAGILRMEKSPEKIRLHKKVSLDKSILA